MDSWSGSQHYYEGRDLPSSGSSCDEWEEVPDDFSAYKYYDGYLDLEQELTVNTPSVAYSYTVPQSRFSDATSDDDDCCNAYGCYDGYDSDSDTEQDQNVPKYSNTSIIDRSTKRVPDTTAEVCQYYTANYTKTDRVSYNYNSSSDNDTSSHTKTDRASYNVNSSSESDGYDKESDHVQELCDIMERLNLNDLHMFTPVERGTVSDRSVTVDNQIVQSEVVRVSKRTVQSEVVMVSKRRRI